MKRSAAVTFVRPAIGDPTGIWADFGAGAGTFTGALAEIVGTRGRVLAVERDPAALRALERLPTEMPPDAAPIDIVAGDFLELDAIPQLDDVVLAGALFANALHFTTEPARVLRKVGTLLGESGRVVIIEYARSGANRWVPYPIPIARLVTIARQAGFARPEIVGERASRYQGTMYCAVLRRNG